MIKEIIALIALLGANTHQLREAAHIDLEKHEVCFNCLLDHYSKDMKDPERRIRLKEILFYKYTQENRDIYTKMEYLYDDENAYIGSKQVVDMEALKRNFKWDIEHR